MADEFPPVGLPIPRSLRARRKCANTASSSTAANSDSSDQEHAVDEGICPVCLEPVRDDGESASEGEGESQPGQDALFCEGECKRWHHRVCACVTKERYATLSNSPEPFLCPSCTFASQQAIISSLQENVKNLSDELRSLKGTVAALQAQPDATTAAVDTEETLSCENHCQHSVEKSELWITVEKKKGRQNNRSNKPRKAHDNPKSNSSHKEQPKSSSQPKDQPHSGHNSKVNHEKELVTGARRIWGTMRNTTTPAVLSAIRKLTTIGDKISVRRKTKEYDGHSRWWFIVKGEEEQLKELDGEWDRVMIQTSWKLEPCYMPKPSPAPPNTED